ncbi:hypothetical protein VQH23_03450 [Pararoseomonas sp. SCSIO 73927]|uniref:hypothetical protein n=1 Tax=Pararoseomonas sp. SCSIO 73927 TaxID=3114537 RepID=UPI0030CFF4CE
MTIRAAIPALTLASTLASTLALLPATPATAQKPPPAGEEAVRCDFLDGRNEGPGTVAALGYQAVIRDGRVAVLTLELPGNRTGRTELVPGPRPGLSVRLTAFQLPNSGPWSTVFNHATLSPEGEVHVETYLGRTDRPGAPPMLNWYRLRCPVGAAQGTSPGSSPGTPPAGPPGSSQGAPPDRKG